MKKVYLFLFFTFSLISKGTSQAAFTAGNLVVFKVGNGTDSLSSAGTAVNIDEYTINGVYVRSHALPAALSGANRRIIASGSAASEGQITRSVDKHFLLVTGYDTILDPARLSIINSTSANVNRVVGVIGADGVIDATTALTDSYSGNNIRGAASTDGTDIWLAGTGSPGTAGVRYSSKGSTTALQLSTDVTNIRTVNIINTQLYISTGSGAFKAISAVGSGLPTAAGETVTVLPGMPNTTDNGPDPYAFAIKPGSADIAYIADARSKTNGGGVQKWTFDGTRWNFKYTLDSGLTTGLRNLIVDWSTTSPTIYCVNGDSYTKNMPGNKIVAVTDLDSTAEFSILATAAPNFMFRGITFAPEPSATVTTYTFTGNGNWNVATNWASNAKPPNPLPASSAIVIDNSPGGQCILNIAQSLSPGSSFIVNAGKNLVIQGLLTIQ